MSKHVDPTVDAGLRDAAEYDAIDIVLGRPLVERSFRLELYERRYRTHLGRLIRFAAKLLAENDRETGERQD